MIHGAPMVLTEALFLIFRLFFFPLVTFQSACLNQNFMHQLHGHTDILNAPLYLYFFTIFYCIYPWPAMIRERVSIHIWDIFIFESQLPFLDEVLDPSLQCCVVFCRVPSISRMIVVMDVLVIPSRIWWLQRWDINWR